MKANSRYVAAVVLTLTGLPSIEPAKAIGVRLLHQDAEAVARGNAFAATADNPSAIYYNPAGITQLGGQNFESNTFAVGYDIQYTSKNGVRADTPDKVEFANQLFYSAQLKASRLFFGLGVYEPYGLSSTWEDGTPFRSLATQSKLLYITFNPVLAWKITDSLSVAAGVTVNASHLDLRRGILAPHDQFQFKGEGVGVGFNIGIMWQPHPMHSFGVRYFSATDIDYDGSVEIHTKTPLLFPSSSEDANSGFHFPMHIAGGYSFRPTPDWNFEFDLDWTDWDSVNSVTVHKKSGNLVDVFDWESSFNYLFGVTRYFHNGVSVSAGYSYIENSGPDATFHPANSDMNFHVASLGVRYTQPRWSVGLTYQFGYGERDVTNSAPSPVGETADGHYKFLSHSLSLSLGAKF